MTKGAEATLSALRASKPRGKKSYMTPAEFTHLRNAVIKTTQVALANVLKNPENGEPVAPSIVSRWERGRLAVPLWAAQRIRMLSEQAKSLDAGEYRHETIQREKEKLDGKS